MIKIIRIGIIIGLVIVIGTFILIIDYIFTDDKGDYKWT
jgi:hypothetical protein